MSLFPSQLQSISICSISLPYYLNLIPIHVQGLGISGWGIRFFYGGAGLWGLGCSFFYGGVGSSIVWVLQVGLSYGSFGGFRVETQVVMVWVFGWVFPMGSFGGAGVVT